MFYAGACGFKLDNERAKKWLNVAKNILHENEKGFGLTDTEKNNMKNYLSLKSSVTSSSSQSDFLSSDKLVGDDEVPQQIKANDYDSVSELTYNSPPCCNCTSGRHNKELANINSSGSCQHDQPQT